MGLLRAGGLGMSTNTKRPSTDPVSNSHVHQIRAEAIALVSNLGKWQNAGPVKLLVYNSGSLQIAYRTPFQKLPDPGQATHYKRAQLNGKPNLPYGLDIWFDGKKVLNVEWGDDTRFDIVSYKPGPWEQALQS